MQGGGGGKERGGDERENSLLLGEIFSNVNYDVVLRAGDGPRSICRWRLLRRRVSDGNTAPRTPKKIFKGDKALAKR